MRIPCPEGPSPASPFRQDNLASQFCFSFQSISRIATTAMMVELAVSLEECQKQTN